ncbi:uncharacterized protein N7498_005747 [Penicillium cinerascens]|uniref:Uncharacterized protein n=1 Tax=Penicillium cinerascens TaxID=70096 RepID=A0A9W9MP62_9EURO|nr:uncharacterized protein N7498_005747 [Penicillium cinerascens]KAJ5204868.1 hypothetical protein N7498_005747 [Penicillium cinerascens]
MGYRRSSGSNRNDEPRCLWDDPVTGGADANWRGDFGLGAVSIWVVMSGKRRGYRGYADANPRKDWASQAHSQVETILRCSQATHRRQQVEAEALTRRSASTSNLCGLLQSAG